MIVVAWRSLLTGSRAWIVCLVDKASLYTHLNARVSIFLPRYFVVELT